MKAAPIAAPIVL